ncbi:MAG: flippase-like domain-containing protein [Calditrichaeota bacterium]|nr:flippase-like domain-containing protein [Calditrichota bacterium]
MKKIILQIVRFAVSIGLLGYLIYLADISKIYATLRQVNGLYFLFALGAFFVGLLFLTWRWKLLLQTVDIRPGYKKLLIFYFIGYFFNNFLPTTIGGDISRAYNVARLSDRRAESVGIVLFERLLGLLATLSLAAFSLFWVLQHFHTWRIVYVTLSMLTLVVLGFGLVLNTRFFRWMVQIFEKIEFLNLGNRLNRVLNSIHVFRTHKSRIAITFLFSLSSQILFIFMNYLLAQSLNLQQVSFQFLLLVIPVAFLLGLLPSINGLGVRDSGYVFLLTRIGLTPAEALSLSFLNTLVPMLMSGIGGIFLIFYRTQKDQQIEVNQQ